MTEFVASPERLIIGALLGFAVLLFLIIKLKIQPFIAIMSSALIIGLVSGMPFSMITDTLAEGVGNTLQTIAILIGLGSMFGAILQVSGGVEVIADTLLKVFGEKKAPWALGITGLIVGMPVFFESGLLILIPVAFGIARKTNKSVFNSPVGRSGDRTCFCASHTGTGAGSGNAGSRAQLCHHTGHRHRYSCDDPGRTGVRRIYR